jgi:ABC-type sugar transport system ATPase subunit
LPAPELNLEALEKTFAGRKRVRALRACSLDVRAGECVAILGASGCGKTTLLRVVAGLEVPDAGTVRFDARDVSREPAERRNVGFVFQNDALFAQMSAYENIAFGLRARRENSRAIDARVRGVAARARATHVLARRAATLSGGERQRVALARALAVDPEVLLFDEPLSRLDAPLRAELRRELAEIVRTRFATTLYVTHDQSEALALGDRIAVMREGTIVQIASASELFERPRDTFVAASLGTPAIAFVPAALVFADADPGERCGVRASAVRIADDGELRGIVRSVEELLDVAYAFVEGPFGALVVRIDDARPVPGERIALRIDRARVLRFDREGTRIEPRVHA